VAVKRSLWYAFIRTVVRNLFFKLRTGGLRSVGEKNVPKEGGIIVAPNHLSHLDPPSVACGMKRQLTFMAKEELFRGFFGKLIRSLGAFPVRRGETDTESIRKSIEFLNEGRALLVFPEGTRGEGKHLLPINRGVAMLAKRTGVPVVPVGIVGSHIILPKGQKKIKRHCLTLVYGEPFTYASVAVHASEKENREAFSQELARRIVALCASEGLNLGMPEAE
jgi:1-acyl-sn-glycerol-3-phosphate acyltransferase